MASRSYYHDHITWCVQKSHPIPLWKNIFHLCNDPLVYILLFLACVSIMWTGYVCQQFEIQKWDWHKFTFTGFRCFMGMPCTYNPKTTANRTGFLFFLFATMIYVCVLSSVLIQLIISPILNPQIQTVQEIIDGEFKLISNRFAFQKIVQHNWVNIFA